MSIKLLDHELLSYLFKRLSAAQVILLLYLLVAKCQTFLINIVVFSALFFAFYTRSYSCVYNHNKRLCPYYYTASLSRDDTRLHIARGLYNNKIDKQTVLWLEQLACICNRGFYIFCLCRGIIIFIITRLYRIAMCGRIMC